MKYHIKCPIRWKLILLITMPILIVYALIVFFNSYWNRKTDLQQMKDYLIELTGHHAANLDTEFAIISQAPQNLAEVVSSLNVTDSEDIFHLIKNAIDNNPYIHRLTVAYEPKAFQNKRFFAPHIRKIESKLQRRDLSGFVDYTLQDWYSIPALLGISYSQNISTISRPQ